MSAQRWSLTKLKKLVVIKKGIAAVFVAAICLGSMSTFSTDQKNAKTQTLDVRVDAAKYFKNLDVTQKDISIYLPADRVLVLDGNRDYILNGRNLVIVVSRIEIKGDIEIASFEDGVQASFNTPGTDSGNVHLIINEGISGVGSIHFKLDGARGGQGSSGSRGATGTVGKPGRNATCNAIAAGGDREAEPGGKGGVGEPGGKGAPGRPGGKGGILYIDEVALELLDSGAISYSARGGSGGPGGEGGLGGDGGPGGPGGAGKYKSPHLIPNFCKYRGKSQGKPGDQGPPGPIGDKGQDGMDGKHILL